MDLDLEIDNDEGNSSEPLFYSIFNVMNSLREATSDKIYQRIQSEGNSNYSKPQVDRALASALKYGIFEVKNNRYRVRDDVLDDEDTIYWQAHIRREKTPYRLETMREDYIHPEKDRHTFRKPSASYSEEFYADRNRKIKYVNEAKGRRGKVARQKMIHTTNEKNKITRNHQDPKTSKNDGKKDEKKRVSPPGRKDIGKRVSHRRIRNITVKDAKKIKRVREDESGGLDVRTRRDTVESSSAEETEDSKMDRCDSGSDTEYEPMEDDDDNDEDEEEDEDDDEDSEDNEDYGEDDVAWAENQGGDGFDTECVQQRCGRDDRANASNSHGKGQSAYLEYMRTPHDACKPFAPKEFTSENSVKTTRLSEKEAVPDFKPFLDKCDEGEREKTKQEYWNSSYKSIGNTSEWNLHRRHDRRPEDEWIGKQDWLENRAQPMQGATIKQLDTSLKIEPLDPLPFRHIEETSYIS